MIILASSSPRRRQLLKTICDDFKIIPSDVNEDVSPTLSPLEAVLEIAKRKGDKIHEQYPHDIVISADTIVILDNQIIGKPKDEEDAKHLLRLLSGKVHTVITAYCLYKDDIFIENHVTSEVLFYELSDQLINDYVATGSPLDKAGAYGVQDNEKFPTVKDIKGSVNNVIGFPIEEIQIDLEKVS